MSASGHFETSLRRRVYPTFQAHFWLAMLLTGFIVLHIGAALFHQFVQRDGLLRRMGFGRQVV
jgi:cytochrome b561